ncbi:MAG: inositol monophosphatase family protein [Verrucomicrobiaceae bacterium]|nr:MAG: inositol monophosphatase family protein [Verrucomicrobiaceae bacterium]
MDFTVLTQKAVKAASNAGQLIRSYRDKDVHVMQKEGGSTLASQVVTEVDRKSQDSILQVLLPTCDELDIALLAEEDEDDRGRLESAYFWCIDPLDGTLPFINGQPGYSVSIGLVANDGTPLIGVVYDPVHDVLYQATKGQGLMRNNERWSPTQDSQALTFTYDRSFAEDPNFNQVKDELEAYAHSLGLNEFNPIHYGGAVLNACHVLENGPGCHFKFPKSQDGGGSLWDYAATACLYEESGAVVSDVFGDSLDLNRADSTFMNHRGALYATNKELAKRVRDIITKYSVGR